MVEIVLVCSPIACFYPFQRIEFREYDGQETAAFQIDEPFRWSGGHDDFVQLLSNPFARYDFDAFLVALECFERFVFDEEVQLGSKSYTAHHAQRVVAEGDIGVEWGSDDAVLEVVQPIEGIDQFTKPVSIQT